jgi:hypothetical protein
MMKWITLFFLMSSYAQANICEQTQMRFVGGTDFYKNFLQNSHSLKQAYTFYYQAVDDALEEHIENNCGKGSEALDREHHALCHDTCAAEARDFHERIGTKFFKKSKIKNLTRECRSICDLEFDCESDALCRAGL